MLSERIMDWEWASCRPFIPCMYFHKWHQIGNSQVEPARSVFCRVCNWIYLGEATQLILSLCRLTQYHNKANFLYLPTKLLVSK